MAPIYSKHQDNSKRNIERNTFWYDFFNLGQNEPSKSSLLNNATEKNHHNFKRPASTLITLRAANLISCQYRYKKGGRSWTVMEPSQIQYKPEIIAKILAQNYARFNARRSSSQIKQNEEQVIQQKRVITRAIKRKQDVIQKELDNALRRKEQIDKDNFRFNCERRRERQMRAEKKNDLMMRKQAMERHSKELAERRQRQILEEDPRCSLYWIRERERRLAKWWQHVREVEESHQKMHNDISAFDGLQSFKAVRTDEGGEGDRISKSAKPYIVFPKPFKTTWSEMPEPAILEQMQKAAVPVFLTVIPPYVMPLQSD